MRLRQGTSCLLVRVAALYDVHGNLPALEAALDAADAEGVDLLLFGGDMAAGPMPVATIDRLAALAGRARFVRGNADRSIVEVFDGTRQPSPFDGWAAAQLHRSQRDFLAAFEPTVELEVDGLGLACFCHAVPEADEPIVTAATPEPVLAEALAATNAALVVAGHVHMQFVRRVGDRRWVNAGSVGMPYAARPGAQPDSTDDTRLGLGRPLARWNPAYWALLGPEVSLRRTEYNVEAAAAAIRATGYPMREDMAAGVVRPPTEEEAIGVFERQAGRRQ